MALFNSMSLRGKLTLAGCVLAFLAASLFIVKMAGKPSYTTVMTGVDPAKTSQITAALTSAGVGYELQNGGTAVAVKKGQETQANVALATKGLNTTSTQPGFEILDKQKLGASSQQQQVAYQRGLEGEIASTIGQIQGAEGARVNLTLGQDNLFADESQPATAAVLLPSDASGMDPASVKGIANLVASAVPNLKAANVTITDGSGTMLWPMGDGAGGDGSGGTLPSKTAAEARFNAVKTASLQALLDRTLGPNKAQVVVNSDLNVDQTDLQSVTYGNKKNVVPLAEKTQTETLKGTGAVSGGTTGASSNLPNQVAAGGGTSGGKNDYKNKSTEVTNGVDKTITKTQKAPGAVNRMDVAIMTDKSLTLSATQLSQLKNTISSAAGLQTSRGDTLNITQGLSFAPTPKATSSSPIPAAFSGILKGAGIGLGALLFLFFVTRHLRRRERGELIDEPAWLKSLEAAQPQPELMPMPTFDPAAAASEVSIATADPRRQQLDNIIHDEPERVAAHLRQWVTEDNK
ncbi:MAG TPA: flagellar basal-body MS-ring/collar protein FliF [Baekduia sp.]|uniref:flagellar basal-body MS-ring/collar protein FliF n=1 Tax=Baekduia sp. TaxID=2600305 RepID=UPI002D78DA2C|nr:flagellar basal-body MS-ring/collar protein FliF [Baekduia sp.]HET6508858.1 flagellar basal-body MS-ring/collar protein FliF [Baekduia sp.]